MIRAAIAIAILILAISFGAARLLTGAGIAGTARALPGHVMLQAAGNPRAIATASDQTAFELAIAETSPRYSGSTLTQFGGGVLEIPRGIYYLPEELFIQGPIKIQGQGRSNPGSWNRGTVVYCTYTAATAGHTGVTFSGRAVTVEGITFRADQTSATNAHPGTLIRLENVQFAYFRDCDFYLNRVAGPPIFPDNTFAAVEVVNNVLGGTTHIVLDSCHIFCPGRKFDGTGGVGYGVLVWNALYDEPTSFVSDVRLVNCTINNSALGSRAVMVAGELPGVRGICNAVRMYGCSVGGRSGVEFCASDRNWFEGVIDLDPAQGDTCLFNTLDAHDNFARGFFDGYEYDESTNPNNRLIIDALENDAGFYARGVRFQPRALAQVPNEDLGAQVAGGALIYMQEAASDSGRLVLKTEDDLWYEIPIGAAVTP